MEQQFKEAELKQKLALQDAEAAAKLRTAMNKNQTVVPSA